MRYKAPTRIDGPQHSNSSEHRNAVRYVLSIVLLLLIVAGLVGVKFTQISTLIHVGKEMQKAGPPPEVVGSAQAQTQTWEGTLAAVGSIAPARGVEVSNDSPGVVSRITFDSGAIVRAGQVLVELDTSVERAQLESAKARLDLAHLTAGRSRMLAQSNTIAKATLDSDEAQLRTSTTDLTALQAQIDRKVIKAPFAGKLGIRLVNLGQYLTSGTPVAVLEAIDSVYVDFTMPQQRLGDIKAGMPVRVNIDGTDGPPQDGVVAAVDPAIDSASRSIRIRATVPNRAEALRPGMFANVTVVLPSAGTVVTIPSTAVVHASYGDSVFVIEDKKDESGALVKGPDGKVAKMARQQFVRLGESRGDFVAVVDGIATGQAVVTAGAFKLRNGASIVVNNDVKLDPQLAPHPINR